MPAFGSSNSFGPFSLFSPFGPFDTSSPYTSDIVVEEHEHYSLQETPSEAIKDLMSVYGEDTAMRDLIEKIFDKDKPQSRHIKYTVCVIKLRVNLLCYGTPAGTSYLNMTRLQIAPRRTWHTRFTSHPGGSVTQD